MNNKIIIKGAKVHNLKNVNLEIPRNKLIVFTGLSGSGKSSLAFDTLYAEGQRRYVESLSAYARQFIGQMDKPDVESIEGLSPAISIDQKTTSKNPRSTVGTITEIYDYLRLLYAHIGIPHCYKCGRTIQKQTTSQIIEQLLQLPQGTKVQVLAPVIKGRKGEYSKLLQDIKKNGFVRVRVDGSIYEIEESIPLDKNKKHFIEIIVDRLVINEGINDRIRDTVEVAAKYSGGTIIVDLTKNDGEWFKTNNYEKELIYSEKFACPHCNISIDEISPRMFSFNNPYGACPECKGLGKKLEFDPDLVIPDHELSLSQGAIAPWGEWRMKGFRWQVLKSLAKHYNIDVNVPYKDLSEDVKNILLYGSKDKIRYEYQSQKTEGMWVSQGAFEGIINQINRLYRQTDSEYRRVEMEKYMSEKDCPTCSGRKLKPEILAVTVQSKNISEFTSLSIKGASRFLVSLKLTEREEIIARHVLKEIKERLNFLVNVGLDYLTLDRSSATLSGGESQRIRLATQIGSGLVGVLYILDEPSIGLHHRDNQKLISALINLRNLGNTVIVVEHDEETIRCADYIVDIGPYAGKHGGEILCAGPLKELLTCKNSITGKYLTGEEKIAIPGTRRLVNNKEDTFLTIKKATQHNLKTIDVEFPLKKFICVTGVSGSGKSTLINDILFKALSNRIYHTKHTIGAHCEIVGYKEIDKVIIIDQSPIGRTPRSNPATYTGMFTEIREVFASTMESKLRGYLPGRFSFNVKGGRCESCQGDGIVKIEMHFLPDVYVPCEQCKGKRYNKETLEIQYKGNTIADVLDMTVEEGIDLFANYQGIKRKLQTLSDVGLGYIHLGQSATTLSGGEAQRVKLATELSRRSTGKTMYILDEPTTGLHFADIAYLLKVLQRLVDGGNTVVVIEHNLDVIKSSDYIIDLGPEGGDDGGFIVAKGTPEDIAAVPKSYTGQAIKDLLDNK
ncbi:MAG: excinuclease ABC subunit UvrA [Candidatus Margulisiibacteriota bacterium]|nr:MAG: excinuclease ABC subunit A [Candidatus Margulisbacteria bacterium GWD2_39_127]OGI05408.1 MAG: excinuclease ABC subunit A [Candidatus Margulisbacteria bacterium GWF2_38_17]OGI08664.1 MAG: excinuclease ABC subunit A [Candidatus Margulisbacteria bacterium GWE2_39_32]PZM77029.1 MAG: excinuclease ABC subunit UvrA [Candidatus Margulisiibacteriota bacterium]HAR62109.1 excinuclease ABC subunit UvrA [Candidatus Margulisiibacteriota bacterium]